ncbi:peptidase domain-containing ABC transporter [Nannocystis sp. SCPEA4]|uniref:peptidase domain-containing ABC transporter n=1 Tax=Nannocystis sp. SCPEA4 TaxID=2996787 RepID=UPI00227023BB|nr:peptidase domain-containing ABC transporter [Nannocystis sp. SCPEA4]MCY1061125.1 peptidase domain-containing ABC transporter [Nannocystis sp. SCPEA4]
MSVAVPFIPQTTAADCGAACLAMVLAFHGRKVGRDNVHMALGTGRDGASALAVLRAAEQYGLVGRGVRLPAAAAARLAPASVLHWEGKHFVVLERAEAGRVVLVDPARGRCELDAAAFARGFSGLALELSPGPDFTLAPVRPPSPTWAALRGSLRTSGVLGRLALASGGLVALSLAGPLLISHLVARAGAGDPELAAWGIVVLLFACGQLVSFVARERLLSRLRLHLDRELARGLFAHLVRLPWGFFAVRPSSDLALRFAALAPVRQLLAAVAAALLTDGALVILYLVVLSFWSWPMALAAIALSLVQVLVAVRARAVGERLSARQIASQAQAQGYQWRALAALPALKAMGSEGVALSRWHELHAEAHAAEGERDRHGAGVDGVLHALRVATPLLLVWFGATQVASGALELGPMLGSTYLAMSFLAPIGSLVASLGRLPQIAGHIERIDDVLRAAPEVAPAGAHAPDKISGAIALDKVSFAYDAHSPAVVRDMSLSLQPGERLCLVGRSGAGKSSLAALLLGLVRPTAGAIAVDGVPLERLDLDALRRCTGVVTQNAALLDGTIRDNIVLGAPGADEVDIIAAAQVAAVHDDILAMPMGYDTVLVDGGANLSGGQRQRIALARALVRRPSLLLLDEATSALDPATEAEVLGNLANLGCTTIMIAHRPSVAAMCDRVAVLERGQLVELGAPAELLARDGAYRALMRV